ncbi:MAG: anaerobic ribonucleoside-triphosphate reductase activating protein [Nitrososphaeria archaeon]
MLPDYLEDFSKIALYGAGWKSISLVDVFKKVAFTIWLCGCNLKCPFCHNYRLAESYQEVYRKMNAKTIVDKLRVSKNYVDYFLVSGGEPLLQFRELSKLLWYIKYFVGVKVGVNTNLTLSKEIKEMLEQNLVNFIATDIKAPHLELYGLDEKESERLWKSYLESLKIVSERKILLEVRIPVLKKFDAIKFKFEVENALNLLRESECEYYIRLNPILGPPYIIARDNIWLREYGNPSTKNMEIVREILIQLGFRDKIV